MSEQPDEIILAKPPAQGLVVRAFGEENRARLLDLYFQRQPTLAPDEAWRHIYRLLLWINPTTGLAHCYESDKCQPGRPWYARSLTFHGWLAGQLDSTPGSLAEEVDWLFKRVVSDLAAAGVAEKYAGKVRSQRAPYEGRGFPLPGEDPEMADLILDGLGDWLRGEPPVEIVRELSRRIRVHVAQENKRKNLVGEGFEDTLAAVLRRVPGMADKYEIRTRVTLHTLPGFHPLALSAKQRQVDMALVRKRDGYRTLVTAKWSIRADREEQFRADFDDYARVESTGQDFDYVLVTNEFDAARLVAACTTRRQNAALFSSVIHVNPEGPLIAYGSSVRGRAVEMRKHIQEGRLASLESWITALMEDS